MRTTVIIKKITNTRSKNILSKKLESLEGISNVVIEIATQRLSFDYTTHNIMEGLRMELTEMGFPITNDPSTIDLEGKKQLGVFIKHLGIIQNPFYYQCYVAN